MLTRSLGAPVLVATCPLGALYSSEYRVPGRLSTRTLTMACMDTSRINNRIERLEYSTAGWRQQCLTRAHRSSIHDTPDSWLGRAVRILLGTTQQEGGRRRIIPLLTMTCILNLEFYRIQAATSYMRLHILLDTKQAEPES